MSAVMGGVGAKPAAKAVDSMPGPVAAMAGGMSAQQTAKAVAEDDPEAAKKAGSSVLMGAASKTSAAKKLMGE